VRQAAIKVPDPKQDSRSLHEILVGILREFGPRKHEALIDALHASKGHFSEVYNDAGKHWPPDWIDYIVEQFDFRNEVASYYARKRGMTVAPPRKPSPAERLRRLEYVLTQHNGLGTALRDEAARLPDDVFADEEIP
jgi:hypothetical protein